MSVTEIIIVGLAAGYMVTAWHHGSIFASVIAWLEHDILTDRLAGWLGGVGRAIGRKLTDLLLCPLCLSPYVCLVVWSIFCATGQVHMSIPEYVASIFASAAITYWVQNTLYPPLGRS